METILNPLSIPTVRGRPPWENIGVFGVQIDTYKIPFAMTALSSVYLEAITGEMGKPFRCGSSKWTNLRSSSKL